MANLNKVFLMGNLTRDPQLSYLPSQTAVVELGLAVNRRWNGQDGQPREETTFVDIVAYGRQAETISKYLKKGRPFFVEGRLKLDQWEAQDGTKRSKMRVILEGFQFIDSRPAGGSQQIDGDAAMDEISAPESRPAPRAYGRPAPAGGPAAGSRQAPPDDEPPPIREDDIPF